MMMLLLGIAIGVILARGWKDASEADRLESLRERPRRRKA